MKVCSDTRCAQQREQQIKCHLHQKVHMKYVYTAKDALKVQFQCRDACSIIDEKRVYEKTKMLKRTVRVSQHRVGGREIIEGTTTKKRRTPPTHSRRSHKYSRRDNKSEQFTDSLRKKAAKATVVTINT